MKSKIASQGYLWGSNDNVVLTAEAQSIVSIEGMEQVKTQLGWYDIVSSIVIIPIAFLGATMISRLQMVTHRSGFFFCQRPSSWS